MEPLTRRAFVASLVALTACPPGGDPGDDSASDTGTTPDTLAARLRYLREEEKLARDVYLTLHDTWPLQVFANIAQSEQRHVDAVRDVLLARGIDDPVVDDTVGVFQDSSLATLYEQLVATGEASQADALWVGCTIEDLDIHDLEALDDLTDAADVETLVGTLTRGSENHMRAFHGQLSTLGETYDVQYISQERLDEILAGTMGACT